MRPFAPYAEGRWGRGSGVLSPDLRPPGGPYPDALRTGTGIGAILLPLVALPALDLAPPALLRLLGPSLCLFGAALGRPGALFGLPGAPLCVLGPSFGLLGATFGFLGSPLGCPGALFGVLDPSLGLLGAYLGLRRLSFGFAPAPCGLLGARLGPLYPPSGLLGAPSRPGCPPMVEGEHGVEEIHVVVRRNPREFPCGISGKFLLSGQLLRYIQGTLGLGA